MLEILIWIEVVSIYLLNEQEYNDMNNLGFNEHFPNETAAYIYI